MSARGLRELFWPLLDGLTAEEKREENDKLERDKAAIQSLKVGVTGSVALEEARRFAESEDARRRGADQKATIYLAVVAALVPLVITLAASVWDKKSGPAPKAIDMVLLGVAVIYATAAAFWAFRVIEVAPSAIVGANDICKIWRLPNPPEKLTRKIILNARQNYDGINKKVSRIKMAHAYLLRAVLVFSALLMFNILWYLGSGLASALVKPRDHWMASATAALAADTEVGQLERELSVKPAAAVLGERCKHRLKKKLVLARLQSSRSFAVKAHMTAIESVRFEASGLWCGNGLVGVERSWIRSTNSLPTHLRVNRSWPPTDGTIPPRLPDVLLRQYTWREDATNHPTDLTITEIRRDILDETLTPLRGL